MNFLNVFNSFSRLSLAVVTGTRNISTNTNPLYFRATNVLLGEPLKRKKRLDPQIVRAREERKKRKLSKMIRKLEKHALQLKPLEEMEISHQLKSEIQKRSRNLPPVDEEELERRILLAKSWSKYKNEQYLDDFQTIDRFIYSQRKALDELKLESEELYNQASEIDPEFLPYTAKGPVHNPPIKNYDAPDGEYINITKKFEGE